MSRSYQFALGAAIALHVLIVVLISARFTQTIQLAEQTPAIQPKPIIDAVAIQDDQLKQEITRLEEQEKAKERAEAERIAAAKKAEQAAKKRREQEEAKVRALKAEQAKAAKALKEKEQKMTELKAQREATEKAKQQAEKKRKDEEKAAKAAKEQADKAKAELAEAKKKQEAAAQKAKEEAKRIAEKKAQEEEAKRIAAEKVRREAEEKRQAAQREQLVQTLISQYAAKIQQRIQQVWRQPVGLDLQDFTCVLAVKLLPTGEVVEARVVESSGNIEFDRSSELAVKKASPLPLPSDEMAAQKFRHFTFTFRPEAA